MNTKKLGREYTRLIDQWAWHVKQAVHAEKTAAKLFKLGSIDNIDLGENYRTIAMRHMEEAVIIKRETLKYLPQ